MSKNDVDFRAFFPEACAVRIDEGRGEITLAQSLSVLAGWPDGRAGACLA